MSVLGAVPAIQLAGNDDPDIAEAANLRNNTVRGNDFGAGGDLNGRDMVYDGSGTGNCFEGNTLRSPNVPGDNGTFAPCPGPAQNTPNPGALAQALSWVLDASKDDPATFEKHWIKHPHPARKGVKPLERFRARTKANRRPAHTAPGGLAVEHEKTNGVRRNTAVAGAALIALAAAPAAISQAGTAQEPVRKTIKVHDNYFTPDRLTVPTGSRADGSGPHSGATSTT